MDKGEGQIRAAGLVDPVLRHGGVGPPGHLLLRKAADVAHLPDTEGHLQQLGVHMPGVHRRFLHVKELVNGKRKNPSQRISSLRRVHNPVMYPRYHSNCAPQRTPLQAPASPMHSRGSHGRRLPVPAGTFGPPARKGWDHEAACCRASTSARLSGSGQPRPSSSSLFLFTC